VVETGDTVEPDELGPEKGPVRLCAVTRVHKAPEAMLRFVADPQDRMVPDIRCRLPGRGVWVDAKAATLAEAVKRNVFAKSLKRKVAVSDDLPAEVERLLSRRVADALALANKAGLIVAGFAKVEDRIASGEVALLLHASDGAEDGASKLGGRLRAMAEAGGRPAEISKELTSEEMSLALGRMNVVHAAATEGGATRRLLEEAGRLRRFRMNSD
jgi:predicted RNA-binding protein YlxR (DUF448 family)